jgi:hypothetical protein
MTRLALSLVCCLLGYSLTINTAFVPVRQPLHTHQPKDLQPKAYKSLAANSNWFTSVLSKNNGSKGKSAADAAAVAALKQDLYAVAKNKDNGLKATESDKAKILALASELIKRNPTKSIATSDKVDGTWLLVYTSTSGGSAGKLGPFVGEVLQKIDTAGGDYVNFVRLFGGLVEGALVATWEVKGANEWKVIFQDITFRVFGIPLVDKKPLSGQAGQWKLTYVDEDLRILTAAGLTNEGKPAKVSNIYVLRRV